MAKKVTTNQNSNSSYKPAAAAPLSVPNLNSTGINTKVTNPVDSIKSSVAATTVPHDQKCPDKSSSIQISGSSKGPGWKGEGFTIKEYNPPKPRPNAGVNAVPAAGSASTPPPYKNVTCGNLLDKEIIVKCSLFTSIKLESCLFQLEAVFQNYLESQLRITIAELRQQNPGIADLVENIKELLCNVANEIQRLFCIIQQVINCIMSVIQAITQIITWAISLPAQFLSQIMTCVSSFISQITGGIASLTGALGSVISAIGCESYQCQAATSLSDIGGTISEVSQGADIITQSGYKVGNAAGKLV